jgi:hypothetical protein
MSRLRPRLEVALEVGQGAVAEAIRRARRERFVCASELTPVHGYHHKWWASREQGTVRVTPACLDVVIPTLERFDDYLWMSETALGRAYLNGTFGRVIDAMRAEFGMGVGEIAEMVGVGERAPHAWRFGRHPKPATARRVMERLYAGDPRHDKWT